MNVELHTIIFRLGSNLFSAWFKQRPKAQTVNSALCGVGKTKRSNFKLDNLEAADNRGRDHRGGYANRLGLNIFFTFGCPRSSGLAPSAS